jgi:hypothetical protein
MAHNLRDHIAKLLPTNLTKKDLRDAGTMSSSTLPKPQPPPFTIDVLNYVSGMIPATTFAAQAAAAAADALVESQNSSARRSFNEGPPPLEALLPASRRFGHVDLQLPSLSLDFLAAELSLQRLEGFNQWFWLLSSPCLPRPLHDCAFLGRTICITESMDRHLGLGQLNNLYLKPIPKVLLDPRFWTDFLPCTDGCNIYGAGSDLEEGSASDEKRLPKCPKRQIFECALGFLFSYTALVSHESDFHVAKEKHLIPVEVPWDGWRLLARQIVSYPNLHEVIHRRFLYGELRLHRLKELGQLRRGGLLQVLVGRLDLFARFFQNNAIWLSSLVAYIAIVLTALQAGLATEFLMDSDAFQSFSYVFTVFSLVAPVLVIIGFAIYFGVDVGYYMLWNMIDAKHGDRMRKARMAKTKRRLNNVQVDSEH